MNPFEAIGNFFGFGRKKKDEDKPKPQVTVKQPSTLAVSNRPTGGSLQAPNSLIPVQEPVNESRLTLGGVEAPKLNAVPLVASAPAAQPQFQQKDEPSTLKKIGAGFQQAGGSFLDALVQGGYVASTLANKAVRDPFISQQRRNELDAAASRSLDQTRGAIGNWKDVTGERIDNRRTDEAADRLSRGQGSVQDLAQVGGRAVGEAGTATMFINPTRIVAGAAGAAPTLRQVAPLVLKEAGVFGGSNALAQGGETYGQTGNLNEAAKAAALGFATGAIPQVGLEGAAVGTRRLITGVSGSPPPIRNIDDLGGVATDTVDDLGRPVQIDNENGTVAGVEAPSRDPSSPITSSPTTDKPPAITSPNRSAPTVQMPQIVMPQVAGNTPPVIQAPVVPNAVMPSIPKQFTTPDEAVAQVQKAIDDAAVQVPNQPPASQVVPVESPKATQTRVIAESQPTVAPVSETQLVQESINDAPTEEIANAIEALSRNAKNSLENDATGMKPGGVDRSGGFVENGNAKPIEVRTLEDGSQVIVDGRHTLEYARQNGINDFPIEDVTKQYALQADELGTIARKAAGEGQLTDDVAASTLADRVGNAIEAEASKLGTTWEDINKKVQAAWSQGKKDFREAGLTQEEFNVARKAADELSLLRSRVDPSLLKEGQVGQFYSPRQAKDTEFTQELVNELGRDKQSGLRDNELDLSTTPYRQAVRRYSNAPEALGDTLIDSLESKVVKDALGNERVVDTGLKVPDDVKAALKEDLKPYIEAQDDAIRAADAGDPEGIDAAIAAGDKAIDDALSKMAAKLPKDTAEARDAIGAMIAERRAYMQSTARTNMFSNVVNRMFDQAQKGLVNFGDQALPLVNKIANKMTGNSQPGLATDLTSVGLARKYSKGTLINQQNRNFMTNVRLAGANARNPVTKTLAKADAAYRAAGTYLTSLGDMSTNAVKATNLAILGKGRSEGLKTAAELEAYLVKNLNSPEYIDIYRNMTNQYSGYIGMPQTLTSTGEKGGKVSDFMSKIDNFTKNALDQTPLPARVKQEINDLIMPAITGFAGATSRVAAKQLNALALGIPNIRRGMKLAASDSPNAKAIGELMISRSIIDGIGAGGVMVGGTLLGASGHWTGEYPTDPNERARWESEGISPNSFSFDVDGKTVYVQPGRILGVLALPAVLPAVIAEATRNGTDPGEAISSVISGTIGQFNENLGADAIIQHVGDIDDLINGNESDKAQAQKSLMNMLGYSISNVNPASGLQNNIASAADPLKRDTSGGVGDVIANRNPFTRQSLPAKTDNLGNEIPNRSQATLGAAAVTVGDGQSVDQPSVNEDGTANLDAEINRLSKAKHEVMPARDVKNSNSQNDAKTLMGSKLYQNADDETKATYLKDTLLGTKTKDISKDLNDTERSALIEYKLQNEDQRKKWLEDNDNSLSYHTADYNNLKARDLLTSDEENLENKSGAKYKMLRSQVDKDFGADTALKQLYSDVSETEWKAMTDPESEDYDPDTAGKLAAYDEARTKAGVSGKSSTSKKPKYVLKTGKGSGKGGAGSDKFSFASLPASLVGNAAGGGSKGYAGDAPTFKPLADLKAPQTASIPKGRSISIKRGIQI